MKRTSLYGIALVLSGSLWLLLNKPQPLEPALALSQSLSQRSDIIAAIRAHNQQPVQDMAARDQLWRRDVSRPPAKSLIAQVMATPLSQTLAQLRQNSGGHILQIMVMDKVGALVAADHITHDYDQSDEPKWQKTVGAQQLNGVHEGAMSLENGIADQVSQAVIDPQQQIIGAITLVYCRKAGACGTMLK
jgi:hypothetical protein